MIQEGGRARNIDSKIATPGFLLPGYASISPTVLVMLRFTQDFGVDGEWGGAALMAVGHAAEHQRVFYGAWPQVGVPTGNVLGTSTYALLSAALSDEQFLDLGWRVPFLASALLIAVGMRIRLTVVESPIFQEAELSPVRWVQGNGPEFKSFYC